MTGPGGQSPSSSDGSVPSDEDEVVRLRAEVEALRERLNGPTRRGSRKLGLRRAVAAAAALIAAFAAVGALVGVWTANTTFNTDRWIQTVSPLLDDRKVTAAVSQYATTQLFSVLDVEDRLKDALPPRAAFAAGPVTGQLQTYVRQAVDQVLRSDRFQAVWQEVNRQAHAQVVAILRNRSDVVTSSGDHVTLDLLPLINQVIRQLESTLPSMFGHQVNLPDLSSGALPANLRVLMQSSLGITLPANFAQFTVYDAGRLRALQAGVLRLKRGLIVDLAVFVVAAAAALWLSPSRRRTVLQFGVWLMLGVLAMTATLRVVRADVLDRIPEGTYRDGVAAAFTVVFSGLRERGWQMLYAGAVLALVAYLAGPGRVPVFLRRAVRRATNRIITWYRRAGGLRPAVTWAGRHVDVLRIAGVAAAAFASLLLSTWEGLLVVVVVLVVYQIGLVGAARVAR